MCYKSEMTGKTVSAGTFQSLVMIDNRSQKPKLPISEQFSIFHDRSPSTSADHCSVFPFLTLSPIEEKSTYVSIRTVE